MIRRTISAIAGAFRRQPTQAQRDTDLRTRLQQHETALRRQARHMLTAGLRAERAAARDGLLFGAAAAAARAEVLHWALGGDAATAAELTIEAERLSRLAERATAEPVEGAHA